ncbi:MAG: hypothetical protein UZ12_BCD005001125 [Bacteroidetes bacterium OLB12]|nr:MAG: hypothetical protein UZ12_BCD005001125 [Bacteroidetes bacterium OLB12]
MRLFIYFIFCCAMFSSCSVAAQQKQVFDIATYTLPTGWQHSKKPETVTVSKEDKDGNFCIITLYKSVESGNDSKQNFDISWEALVQNVLATGKATMQPAGTDNGWVSEIGSAPFEKDGIKGAAILITSTGNGKMINTVIITNTNKYQKEMELFLDAISLSDKPTANNNTSANTSIQSSKQSNTKPELWSLGRYISGDMSKPLAWNQRITDYYVIYPNGDYFPNVPFEGLTNFDKSYYPESWGQFTMNGTKGIFKNKYDEKVVTKKSAIYMERNGYVAGFHKCLDVDSLRIEGAYTHVAPDWGKDPQLNYLDEPGCQFSIYFRKDGTFDDRGIFSSLAGGCTNCNCKAGKGTYSIENFTITFKYDDGRMVTRLFSAPPTRNPKSFDEVYYLGGTAYYKKK